jgi:hypothetical protein
LSDQARTGDVLTNWQNHTQNKGVVDANEYNTFLDKFHYSPDNVAEHKLRNQHGTDFNGINAKQHKRLAARRTASVFQRRVPGWHWDDHLAGYITTAARDFMCSCGERVPVPSYSECHRCGKVWNSYCIGTGGDNRTGAVDKIICRRIPRRPEGDVIVAKRRQAEEAPPSMGGEPLFQQWLGEHPNFLEWLGEHPNFQEWMEEHQNVGPGRVGDRNKRAERFNLEDPGECKDGQKPRQEKTFKQPPDDWAWRERHKKNKGRWAPRSLPT